MASGYIASTIPARTVRVSDTTLFQVAMEQLGDPLRWVELAQLNGLTDPWIVAETAIKIPPVLSTSPLTGILGV